MSTDIFLCVTFAQYGMTRLRSLDIKRRGGRPPGKPDIVGEFENDPGKVVVNVFMHVAC